MSVAWWLKRPRVIREYFPCPFLLALVVLASIAKRIGYLFAEVDGNKALRQFDT
jgi:hypothetical protein